MQFVIFEIENTNAALPINTNANNVELTETEVPALKKREEYQLENSIHLLLSEG